ncbi:hypothetical protein [Glycomyces harbinensis]|uniref:Four helix bundle sensory module for signal transduction n=1 Tax=Glycomyces harbinensis TaxID=58114 RepID=A0A1G6R495_9ACTN|nr:hypothetical protein [Glycomyces harbinensis]SDC99422.1 hypothetical protein SAMN05216270_101287 [Glycomyces harbinensis]
MTASRDDAALGRLGLRRGTTGTTSLWSRAAVVVIALVAMVSSLAFAVVASRDALDTIGHESGPQVVATADLYFALSDADTQVATAILLGETDPDATEAAAREYARLRGDIAASLLEAHRLAGAAATQRDTIESIMTYYGEYEQLAAEALLQSEQAAYTEGQVPEAVLEAYRAASDLMQGWILPQAYNLTLENGTIVREAHDEAQSAIRFGIPAVALAGAAALAALIWLQVYFAQTFRRLLSPALLVATAVTGLYLYTGVVVLDAERDALAEAKTDGFDAALSLERAKAISNSLHADQIRFLLDPERADVYEQTYFDKAQQLVYVEAGNLEEYAASLEGAPSDTGLVAVGLDGSASGDDALAAYTALIRADAAMRASDAPPSERLATVVAAIADYEAALKDLSGRHLDLFADAIGEGESAIADFAFLLPAALVSLAVFTFSGIVPRLRELS